MSFGADADMLGAGVLQEIMRFHSCVVFTGGGVGLKGNIWGLMQHGVMVRL